MLDTTPVRRACKNRQGARGLQGIIPFWKPSRGRNPHPQGAPAALPRPTRRSRSATRALRRPAGPCAPRRPRYFAPVALRLRRGAPTGRSAPSPRLGAGSTRCYVNARSQGALRGASAPTPRSATRALRRRGRSGSEGVMGGPAHHRKSRARERRRHPQTARAPKIRSATRGGR